MDTVERRTIIPPLPPPFIPQSLPTPEPVSPPAPPRPASSSSSSSATGPKSFLISPPPPPPHSTHHKAKTPIPSIPSTIGNSNPTFAPRITSSTSQKINRTPSVPVNVSTRPNLPNAQKRSAPMAQAPPLPLPLPFPTTAIRNSNTTNPPPPPPPSAAMRINSSTTPAFDGFQINSTIPPRRPSNGIPHNSNTPTLSTRNPIRVRPVLFFSRLSHSVLSPLVNALLQSSFSIGF